ncbi:alpha-mannosidase [Limnochorda pilosa]|uniref:Alpha-mannosidase n=1 Tax=Limnochorda pilosa TaxID=1555112 RepID=A0A0K2SIV4_LIMPI|nr:glycoside hydrolase family 38 C-terminal domain-containing protein [Limnochorda pilosa]BAS27038.1 alpha-mannosidase [Limnochorda pilosa]
MPDSLGWKDPLARRLEAARLRLAEFRAWSDLDERPVEEVLFEGAEGGEAVTLRPGDPWPSRGLPARFTFAVTAPRNWAGQPVRLAADVEGEALISVNGRRVGALVGPAADPLLAASRREHLLTQAARGGETFHVVIEAVPRGPFGTPVYEPRFREARALVPDPQVRALYEDLLAVWDAAQALDPTACEAERLLLVELLEQAFHRLRLPDGATGPYLAAIGRTREGHRLLRDVWDEWDPSAQGPPPPLEATHRESLEEATALLHDGLEHLRGRFGSQGALALTGHAHIDLAWLWPLDETRRKLRRTFSSVLALMEHHPDFIFNQSSAQVYRFVEEDDPELFHRLRERVAEGRWEPVGGSWVEMDCNLTSGESLVRQMLLGQRYFQRAFGRRSRVAWLPDTFGFTGALPQILRQAGIDFLFTTKVYWNDRDLFPHDLFWWEGLDGSRVLAHLLWNEGRGYNGVVQAHDLLEVWRRIRGKTRHPESLFSFGWGDGGGGPTEEMLDRYQRLKDFPALPSLRMSRVEDFFDRIDRTQILPVWTGEMYLEFHRGTYTTQGRVKQLNRRAEHRLYEAEALAAVAWSLNQAYPREELREAWETLLRNQFHDILPGSSVRVVSQEAEAELGRVVRRASALRDEAARNLAARIPAPLAAGSPEGALVVWNLRSGSHRLALEATAPAPIQGPFRLISPDGREVPWQETESGLVVTGGAPVQGVGYVSLAVVPGRPAPIAPQVRATENELENGLLRVQVNRTGALASVYDLRAHREILEGDGNRLVAFSDRPATYDAWDVDEEAFQEGLRLEAEGGPRLVEAGPLRAAIEHTYRLGGAVLRQRYVLAAGSPRLDIETWIDWTGRRTLLKALFPLAVRAHEATFETAYGAVTRPTHRNTSWDQARFEVPAHRWADLSEGGYGVSLLNDGRYGHSARGNVLGLTLLRSPIHPDPYADEGTHHFTYALYPHEGDWRNGTVAEAESLNAPLVATWTDPEGDLPPEFRLLEVGANALRLGAVKLAEDDESLIVRLYEAHGSRGEAAVRGQGPLAFGEAEEVNLLDDAEVRLPVEQAEGASLIRIRFLPYQIRSVKLTRSPRSCGQR